MSSAATSLTTHSKSEEAALNRLIARLVQQFPEVPDNEIVCAVHGRYQEFDGSPDRDFIPVLVERSARQTIGSLVPRHRA